MFKFNELNQIHLEITNNCQASCPMCARTINGGEVNPRLELTDWSLDDFKRIMNLEVLNQISGFYFCGNYGDPILNNNLIEMCKYATSVNPNCQNVIHTNGGARNTEWWQELFNVMPKNHRVVFALDGLDDTHSLYRVGTKFETVIQNAKAFIDKGGNAEWVFIRFKHNQHQVEQAKLLSKKLGFNGFTVKNSSRFLLESKIQVINRRKENTHTIEPATDTPIKFIDRKTIDKLDTIINNSTIQCMVQKNKEIFIDAHGQLFPCCHTGVIPYSWHTQPELIHISEKLREQHFDMVKTLGELDTRKRTIKEIIDSDEYQNAWETYWTIKKLIVCVRTCGVGTEVDYSRPVDQWVK